MKTLAQKILAALTSLVVAFTLLVPALSVATPASAQIDYTECAADDPFCLDNIQGEIGLQGDGNLGVDSLRTTIVNIVKVLLSFLGLIAIIIILYAGFVWMTAAGNEERVGTARATLTAGLIGLIIILAAYALTSFVVNIVMDIIAQA